MCHVLTRTDFAQNHFVLHDCLSSDWLIDRLAWAVFSCCPFSATLTYPQSSDSITLDHLDFSNFDQLGFSYFDNQLDLLSKSIIFPETSFFVNNKKNNHRNLQLDLSPWLGSVKPSTVMLGWEAWNVSPTLIIMMMMIMIMMIIIMMIMMMLGWEEWNVSPTLRGIISIYIVITLCWAHNKKWSTKKPARSTSPWQKISGSCNCFGNTFVKQIWKQ